MLKGFGEWLVARCEGAARRAPLGFSLVLAAGLFAIAFASLEPSFQSNDDPQLAMIAAGKGACLAPDEHLVFTNVIIGHALKWLYRAAPSIPWYGGYLYLVQYLAQVAILYGAIAARYTRLRLGLYLLFFGSVGVLLLNSLQFTTTAALAGQSGALLCLLGLSGENGSCQRRKWPMVGGGLALLVLSSLIRLECFYLAALCALPAAACLVPWPPRRAVLLPAAGAAGVCLAVVLALAAYNDHYYARDPLWRHFASYNALRIKFNDYGWTRYTPETAGVFEQVHWSENDHAMIANWFYEDPSVYSEARLRQVLDSYPWQTQRLTAEYWSNCARTVLSDRALWPGVLVLPFVLMCAAWSRRTLLAIVASLTMAVTLLAAVAAFNKAPPPHVYFPVLTFPLALLLMVAREGSIVSRQRWPGLARRCLVAPACWRRGAAGVLLRPSLVHAVLILAVAGTVYGAFRQHRRGGRMAVVRRELQQSVASLRSRDDQLYVVWAPSFPYEAISPFDNLDAFTHLHQLVLGWPQHTPLFQAVKQKFGVGDVSQAIYRRADVFFVGNSACLALCRKYLQEHHDVDAGFAIRRPGGRTFDVGQFEPRAGAGVASMADGDSRPGRTSLRSPL